MKIKLDREKPSQTQRDIEAKLRNHPKGGREIFRIAGLMPGSTRSAQTLQAQLWAIAFVEEAYQGNVNSFLRDYAENKINHGSIIQYAGRNTLGLSPLDNEGMKIYG